MTKNSNIKSWLSYWKKTLADVDRKRIDVTTNPISVKSYFISQVPQKHAKFLWNISKVSKETKYINVDICPCSVKPEFEHGKLKEIDAEIYYPFWIPAIMYKDGRLAPQITSKTINKPFFVREYLEPNLENSYKISSIKEVDKTLQKEEFKDAYWKSYWAKCESFFELITGKTFEEFNVSHEKYIFVQKGELRGLTDNILNLYKRLEEDYPKGNLLEKLINKRGINYREIPNKLEVIKNKKHIGQMNGQFPLSVSQRESIFCFNNLENSNVLAVNGPPGTGKTTFLQSVVANSVVSTVVNGQKPELIIACSANNQAITNILDSFALGSKDKLTERWLPELTSLGLYLSTNQSDKYQVCTSEYGDGFLNDYESDNVDDKKYYFLEKSRKSIGESIDIESCKSKLLNIVKSKVSNIKRYIEIAENYEKIEQLLHKTGFSNFEELEKYIYSIQQNIDNCNLEIQQILNAETSLNQAKEQQSFIQKIFHFLPKFKKRRAILFQRILLNIKFKETPDYSNYENLVHLINEKIISKTNLIKQLNEKLKPLKSLENRIKDITLNYNSCIDIWNNKYIDILENLYSMTGKEYQNLRPLEDMQIRMDISYRYEAFWYAIHFREAEYLLNLEVKQNENSKSKERSKDSYKEKLQRFAGITPIYISTFHSMPKFATFYDNIDRVGKAYYNLFDLIIVDEAGQVPPDIAMPSFSLAKKAIVVGDVFQIEPVWSVEENLDIINLKMNSLLTKNISNDLVNDYKNSGLLCSNGNLMRVAQQACFVRNGNDGGTLLKEHRRCPDKIISYSNKNVYQNKLILTKGNKRKMKTDLPLKGFMHIDSTSEKNGNSRQNPQDAIVISKWIESKRIELENDFNKPISEILAIVTPYKSQALLIKNELLKIDRKAYQKLISGTVHALQGAEIDIVIFSTVVTPGNSTFFADNLNMLNVAVSRAKSSFLAFGNLNAISATKNSPLGRLKQWLQEEDDCELSNKMVFDNQIIKDGIERINDLETHIRILDRAFEIAKDELIIVSPFISSNAIECDEIRYFNGKNELISKKISSVKEQLNNAIKRGVKVKIITDSTLDMYNNQLKPNAQKGREIIKRNGAELKIVNGIHSKTIIIDNSIIIDGSFNWLSALRNQENKYHREECSIVVQGELAENMIKDAKTHLKNVIKPHD